MTPCYLGRKGDAAETVGDGTEAETEALHALGSKHHVYHEPMTFHNIVSVGGVSSCPGHSSAIRPRWKRKERPFILGDRVQHKMTVSASAKPRFLLALDLLHCLKCGNTSRLRSVSRATSPPAHVVGNSAQLRVWNPNSRFAFSLQAEETTVKRFEGLRFKTRDHSGSESPISDEEERLQSKLSDPHATEAEKFQCNLCSKTYSTFSGLAKHKQLHCDAQSRKSFSCKYCDKEYVSLGALKMHIRTHTLPCVCKICGKAFSRPWLLQGHIRTHTGEKPFSCPHCNRAFADRSNLRAHLQTHSDVKKYQCKNCSKTFSRMSLLHKHEESGCCVAH
ncbi:zinc finger protein snai2 [Lynx pardinus]|uniref:Zinc finger protein SNAI2 n=1 Tax=Lynx pardinus TaxID=191816 RepID=A0A485PEB0_LYNPA|nr:zinc finger protein snai2 [Lynx pardinus]